MSTDRETIRQGIHAAHERILAGYSEWGGHRFHGWTDETDQENYDGTTIWSESDCVLRSAIELEREFPGQVHCGVKINKSTRADFPAEPKEPPQTVDIALAGSDDLSGPTASERFRTLTYSAFMEVKWFRKGWLGNRWELDARERIKAVEFDLLKLDRHLRVGRCQVAAALIWDDEGFLETEGSSVAWPAEVERLLVGPLELARRGIA